MRGASGMYLSSSRGYGMMVSYPVTRVTGASKLVTPEAAREAIRTSVPAGTEDLNLSAFEKGYEMGVELVTPHLQEVPA